MKNENERFFNRTEFIFFILIISVGLFLRWFGLDLRPFHHDESLHATYGAYNYFNGATQYYKYSAMLHGPLLYDLIPISYDFFGFNDFGARATIALLGSIHLFMPLIFRKILSRPMVIISTLFWAISPLFVYYSRFLREDFVVLTTMLIMIFAFYQPKNYLKAPLFFIGLTLHWTCKENVFLTMSLIFGFIVFEYFVNSFLEEETLLLRFKNFLKAHWVSVIVGLMWAIFIFCFLFSAQFRYTKGILDGVYRESILYWFEQHSIERIKGPFVHQLLMISWYDFIFLLTMIYQLINVVSKMNKKLAFTTLFFVLFSIIVSLIVKKDSLSTDTFFLFFKLKEKIDVWWLLFLIPISVIVTLHHLLNKEKLLAIFGYGFYASFFTYSYVGEKVPWLCLYPYFFGFIYFVLYFNSSIKDLNFKKPIVILLLALATYQSVRITIKSSFTFAGHATEYISQVHTTPEFHQFALKTRKLMEDPTISNGKTLVLGEGTWPATWYFFNREDYYFFKGEKKEDDFRYILKNASDSIESKNFIQHTIHFRGWWVPDMDKLNLKNFIWYALFHVPWNDPGYTDIEIFESKTTK